MNDLTTTKNNTITIRFADVTVSVDFVFKKTINFFTKYITTEPAKYHITSTKESIQKQYDEWLKIATEEEKAAGITKYTLEYASVHYQISEILLDEGYLLFHGSALAVDGNVYIFTAPSGTGKSTHAALWRELLGDKVTMVNDDKPYLICRDNKVYACGTPWDGKHRLSNDVMLPVKAICRLKRGETNHIEPITLTQAFDTIYRQILQFDTEEQLKKVLELLAQIIHGVSFYKLTCNMELQAAKVAYEALVLGKDIS